MPEPSPSVRPPTPRGRSLPAASLPSAAESGAFQQKAGTVGVIVVGGCGLGLLVLRALDGGSPWIDEIYSLLLTTHPAERILAESAVDSSPPLYYLLLKAWLAVERQVWGQPSLAGARSLGLVVLLGTLAVLGLAVLGLRSSRSGWWRPNADRPDRGSTEPACAPRTQRTWLALLGVGVGAGTATMIHDLRPYGLASCALLLAAVCLLELYPDPLRQERRDPYRGPTSTAGRRFGWWSGFVACATVAVWTQLLSAVVLALLLSGWWLLRPRAKTGPGLDRRIGWQLAGEGALASLAVILLFSPWLPRVAGQVRYVSQGAAWMTPANGENLLSALVVWLPFGRVGASVGSGPGWLLALGAAAWVVPLAAWLVGEGRSRARRAEPSSRPRHDPQSGARAVWLLVGTALASVLAFWILARLGIAQTFHGPRHPLLLAPILGLGLALAAARGAPRRWPGLGWLLLAPWLAAGLVGQWLSWQAETARDDEARARLSQVRAEPREPVFLYPSELVPFYRELFTDTETGEAARLLALEDLAAHATPGGDALVVRVEPWGHLGRPHDHVARIVLAEPAPGESALSRGFSQVAFPNANPELIATRLQGLDPQALEALARWGFASAYQRRARVAPALALPEGQRPSDGWSYLEHDRPHGLLEGGPVIHRWSAREVATLRLAGPARGCRVLRLHGLRSAHPAPVVEMWARSPDGTELDRWSQAAGPFERRIELPADGEIHDRLRLGHATWSPAEVAGSEDGRRLGFRLLGAHVEDCDSRSP